MLTERSSHPAPAIDATRARPSWPRLSRWIPEGDSPLPAIVVFLAPAVLIYALFTAYPVFQTILNSFFTIKPRGHGAFIGLKNYIDLFSADPIFWKTVANTMIWSVVG